MPKPEKKPKKNRYTTCNAENCRKPRHRRGLCTEHFAKEYPGKKAASAAATPAAEAPAETAES
jgi:hypothetical protein